MRDAEDASLEELLVQYAQADPRAFEAFYELTSPVLYRFLLARLGSHSDAEEALQDTYLRIHKHVHRFDPEKGGWSWCFTVARNAMIDLYHRRPKEVSGLGPESSAIDNAPAREGSQEDQLLARQELETLLSGLSPEEATLLRSRFLEDKTLDELAREWKVQPANARQKVSRLLRKLRKSRSTL